MGLLRAPGAQLTGGAPPALVRFTAAVLLLEPMEMEVHGCSLSGCKVSSRALLSKMIPTSQEGTTPFKIGAKDRSQAVFLQGEQKDTSKLWEVMGVVSTGVVKVP